MLGIYTRNTTDSLAMALGASSCEVHASMFSTEIHSLCIIIQKSTFIITTISHEPALSNSTFLASCPWTNKFFCVEAMVARCSIPTSEL